MKLDLFPSVQGKRYKKNNPFLKRKN